MPRTPDPKPFAPIRWMSAEQFEAERRGRVADLVSEFRHHMRTRSSRLVIPLCSEDVTAAVRLMDEDTRLAKDGSHLQIRDEASGEWHSLSLRPEFGRSLM